MKPFVLLFLLIAIASSHKHTYKCVFDQQNKDLRPQAANNVPEISVHSPGEHLNGRLLLAPSTTHYHSLRIAVDTSYFSNSTIVPPANGTASTTFANLNFILQALAVTQHFYQTRLQAAPLTAITVPSYCVDFYPSNNGSTVNDTELLIFARYLTDPSKSYGATGKSCDWITWASGQTVDYTLQVGRPTVGRIIFNTYQLVDQEPSLSNRLFQSVAATTIHQVTHILGFDSTLYNTFLDIFTGRPYNYSVQIFNSSSVNSRRPRTSILTTPNVKYWSRNYYGCTTLPGMLLQNEDGTGLGSASHWERTAIYDQLMTGTAFGDSKGFFGLTFALLKDTGWYLADDTFAQISNYGYKKGCSFVLDACYSPTPFTQFCDTASQPITNSYCQSTFRGKAVCSSQAANMADSCGIYVPYYNCADPDSISTSNFQRFTNQIYATNSFCVGSTLGTMDMPSQLLSRCYPYTCGTSSIVFDIGSFSITCLGTEAGAIKTLSALKGSLICPDFNDFCTNSRKVCSNWCSQNGFCTGGVCTCLPNRFGSDCSVTTCTVGNYYNPLTASCTSSCPPGTYQNVYSHTCVACQAPCYQCVDTPTNCLSCLSTGSLTFFYGGQCYSSCPNITYTSGGSCLPCDTNADCRTCSMSATNCTSCSNNKYWSNGACVASCPDKTDLAYSKCVNGCASYLLLNGTTCHFCANGTYLRSGACQPNCTVSTPPYLYADQDYHACLACSNACLTCDGPFPENCTSCDTSSPTPYLFLKMCWSNCPRGFYPNSVTWKCEMCPIQLNCQTCVFNVTAAAPYCASCRYGTFFFSANSTCLSSCNATQFKNAWNNSCDPCHSNCATCNGGSSFSCLSCTGLNVLLTNGTGGFCLVSCPTVGYTKVGLSCQLCDDTCNVCNGTSSSNCTSCTSGYYYYGGFCRYICPAGTYPDTFTLTCQPCAGSCSYCFNNTASSCTSCVSGKYLFNFTCHSVCPNGMTPNQWNVCYEKVYKLGLVALGVLLMLIS